MDLEGAMSGNAEGSPPFTCQRPSPNTPSYEPTSNETFSISVGMEFEDSKAAYIYYLSYAKRMGFSVRKEHLRKTKEGIIRNRRFVCSREGWRMRDRRDIHVKVHRAETRMGCEAKMTISLYKNGKYRALQLYTPEDYALFKDQYKRGIDLVYEVCKERMDETIYLVFDDPQHAHEVTFSSVDTLALCTCKKFEFTRILCRHVIRIFLHNQIRYILDRYILQRWTREAANFVLSYSATPPSNVTDSKKIKAERYSKLLSNFVKLSTIAATDLKAYEIAENMCMKANQQINEFLKNPESKEQFPKNVQMVDTVGTNSNVVHMNGENPSSNTPPLEMNDPGSEVIIGMRRREEKGRRRRRYKSSFEMNARKRRRNEPIGNLAHFNATTSEMYNAPHVLFVQTDNNSCVWLHCGEYGCIQSPRILHQRFGYASGSNDYRGSVEPSQSLQKDGSREIGRDLNINQIGESGDAMCQPRRMGEGNEKEDREGEKSTWRRGEEF
ncbi:hypothetical protein Taro_003526 [Colocasia esculenta]|uniref:Protein FAR1-RELATED SEQUENCE n=1 Tax=Colocasia esculenta TaxID=4460 RepID=A0A843TS54_COLES|nr:hypothetical protein [Colocasia esculenta]